MEQEQLEIDAAAVAQQALQARHPGEDLDEALLRTCKQMYGEHGVMAFEGVRNALAAVASRTKVDIETALQQVAGGKTSLRVRTVVNKTVTLQGEEAQSLDELPPEVRAQVEQALDERTGRKLITSARVVRSASPSPAFSGIAATPKTYRCSRCGYESQAEFKTCPQCGVEQKRPFWARVFGR